MRRAARLLAALLIAPAGALGLVAAVCALLLGALMAVVCDAFVAGHRHTHHHSGRWR